MSDLIYCGTAPVDLKATQAMLAGEYSAIWAPPMHRRAHPSPGDRIWLLWRAGANEPPILLGGGTVLPTPEGKVDWTNRTAPGIVAAARALGYGGPSNMAFLRLERVQLYASRDAVPALGAPPIGLSETPTEVALQLQCLLPL